MPSNLFSLIFFFFFLLVVVRSDDDIYSFTVDDGLGSTISLRNFRGKTLLIVNVASECGYTDGHYKDLVTLQNRYASKNFQVIAFPCNEFGQQEPKDTPEIRRWAERLYDVNFPIYGKVSVLTTSSTVSPLFKYLQEKTNQQIGWNFHKFLVSPNGRVIGGWAPSVAALQLEDKIKDNLPGAKEEEEEEEEEDDDDRHEF